MPIDNDTDDDVVRRGEMFYEQNIRAVVDKAENKGKLLVINVSTGEWVIDGDDVAAAKRAKVRFGSDPLYSMRVGHRTAFRIGKSFAWSNE